MQTNVFYSSNSLAYFWRAKHKQQIVFYLYFYVPWFPAGFKSLEVTFSLLQNRKILHNVPNTALTFKLTSGLFSFNLNSFYLIHPEFKSIGQWFPTGLPQHTRVSQRGVKGAAKFRINVFLLMFYYKGCQKLTFLTK